MVKIENERGIYYIYIDGKFYCSCENRRELDEELEDLQRNKIIL